LKALLTPDPSHLLTHHLSILSRNWKEPIAIVGRIYLALRRSRGCEGVDCGWMYCELRACLCDVVGRFGYSNGVSIERSVPRNRSGSTGLSIIKPSVGLEPATYPQKANLTLDPSHLPIHAPTHSFYPHHSHPTKQKLHNNTAYNTYLLPKQQKSGPYTT